ncbi:MAG: flagellar hook-associated protein FlgL [Burkholderiales bacterium]
MRISTGLMFEVSTRGMLNDQAELLRTQQQMASGRRMLAASDDPVAASQALGVRAAEALSAQQAANQSAVRSGLEIAEAKLALVGELLTDARSLIVAAGDGVLANSDRQSIAAELRGLYAELLGMANAQDGQGRYLFAGYRDGSQPFTQTAAGVVYNGDQGNRALAVSGTRQIAVSDNGYSIFEMGRSGNGVFKTALPGSNTGTVAAGVGSVYDATLLTGRSYRIVFNSASTYDVLDVTAGSTLSSGNAYASGTAIRFAGMEIAVEGTPAGGDRIDVTPSANQSLFQTLADAINAVSGTAAAALRAAGLGTALAELDSGADRVLSVRADFGSRLRELDDLGALGESERALLAGQRSKLEDVDYAKAASDFQRQQLALQAAQQTHVRMSAMSLFNFIG